MACFVKTLTRESVKDIEIGNPFLRMKLFPFFGVENKPLTLEDVPQEFRPYPGCIFDVLSEPDKQKRREGMIDFFANLCNDKCPTRRYSLLYTVMHCWKAVFAVSMSHPPQRHILRTFEWMVEVGMFQSLIRILNLCLEQDFLIVEYNRYIPYRILEIIFGAMQAEMVNGDDLIKYIIEDLDLAVKTFVAILEGKLTFAEQLMMQQVIGNFSCYPRGMILLVDAPYLAGLTGKYLWIAYDLSWYNYTQYEDRKLAMHRHMLNTDIDLDPGAKVYLPGPKRSADLCTYSALCCMCNICAGYPDECGMDKVDDCLIALVKEGYYHHLGTIATGIHLSVPKYSELTIDKFLSLTSWSGFNHVNQKIILDQLESLPAIRKEDPLMFFPTSKCRGRSVIAFLITHALWLDFDRGTHFSILGLMYLLKEIPKVGKAVVDVIGPQLVDLGHSIHHVKLPGDGDPMAVKRGLFEPILTLAGMSYYTEQGNYMPCKNPVYKEEDLPESILEIREFCLRHIREIKQRKEDRERNVLLADALKVEGNAFYGKGELEAAIECYTRALDTCPLKCTEKRVTYHSNRAECYLQTNQPKKAIRDCNRALAMNPFNMKARWRRSQAFQKIDYNYPAALDLLTIQGKEEDALKIIGKKAYKDLEATIFNLMDGRNFKASAILKYSNRLHNDTVHKASAVKTYDLERSCVPPYRAKTYLEIFGRSPGGYEMEYDSENEHDDTPKPTRKWEMSVDQDKGEDVDELELELRKEKGRMNRQWLYRDNQYLSPAQKMALERELLEERRLVLESFKKRREQKKAAADKQKLLDSSNTDKEESVEENDGVKTETKEREGEESVGEKAVVSDGGKRDEEEKGLEDGKENGEKPTSEQSSSKASLSNWLGGLEPAVGTPALRDFYLTMETMNVGYERTEQDIKEFEELETGEK